MIMHCLQLGLHLSRETHLKSTWFSPSPPLSPPPLICYSAIRSAIFLFIDHQRELHTNYVAAVPRWNFRNLYFWIDKVATEKERKKTIGARRSLFRALESLRRRGRVEVSRFNFLPR